jgi:hypothetical protein
LAQLETAGLIRPAARPARKIDRSRRAFFRTNAVAAGVVLASPVLFSIIAPSVAEAASCGKKNQPCCATGGTGGDGCDLPRVCFPVPFNGTCQ